MFTDSDVVCYAICVSVKGGVNRNLAQVKPNRIHI